MKKCPGCNYLWADDYTGTCLECGKPLGAVTGGGGDLGFRFAGQRQAAEREAAIEGALRGAQTPRGQLEVYDRVKLPDPVFEAARKMVVQREEVEYQDDAA